MKKVYLFQNCSSVEQCFFICKLKPVLFLPGDNVLREGERGDNLYFLNKGELSVSIDIEIKGADGKKVKDRKFIKTLQDGALFGEVALFTKLKRTATIDSEDFSNCAFLTQQDVSEIEENFPHLATKFKSLINEYVDEKMAFRRLMLRNLHYLRDLNDTIIDEIICHLEVKRYAKESVILKNGDVSNKLMFLREGEIEVKVSNQISQDCEVTDKTELRFDILNTGSCFCAYSFICDDAQQLQKFVSKSKHCIVESISREDFFKLARKYYQLSDKLDFIREKF